MTSLTESCQQITEPRFAPLRRRVPGLKGDLADAPSFSAPQLSQPPGGITGGSGIQRNKVNRLWACTHQRGASISGRVLLTRIQRRKGNTARSSGFPPNPVVPPSAVRLAPARMTARRHCLPLTVNVCTLSPRGRLVDILGCFLLGLPPEFLGYSMLTQCFKVHRVKHQRREVTSGKD